MVTPASISRCAFSAWSFASWATISALLRVLLLSSLTVLSPARAWLARTGRAARRGILMSIVLHRTQFQFIQPRLDLRPVADHQHGALVGMNVLLCRRIQIGNA